MGRRALASPASLKGVLGAVEAAVALADGFRAAGVAAVELPVADGGDGTIDVLRHVVGGDVREVNVEDPLGRPARARYLVLRGGTVVVESAEAIGLRLLRPDELDPLRASSRGLGLLVARVLERERPERLVVGLGGSATVDGGSGVLEVLSVLPPRCRVEVLCDVDVPLLGPRGAARMFGPQKGATPDVVEELERRLALRAELVPWAEQPGAGAAGGLGAAFAALGGELVPGAERILDLLEFDVRVRDAELVVTGEGVVDETTRAGKAPAAVLRRAAAARVRCAVFGGRVLRPLPGAETHELSGRPERSREDLAELGERLGRRLRCPS